MARTFFSARSHVGRTRRARARPARRAVVVVGHRRVQGCVKLGGELRGRQGGARGEEARRAGGVASGEGVVVAVLVGCTCSISEVRKSLKLVSEYSAKRESTEPAESSGWP